MYRYRNYRYCFQHILEDKSAPFISCQYISKITKRRCHNPALKNEQSLPAFCEIHELSESSSKLKSKSLPYENRETTDELSAYKYGKLQGLTGNQKLSLARIRFNEIDAKSNSNWSTATSSSWKTIEADIDADSCDDDNGSLTNAGVYTLEEVAKVSKERLMKLQSLYIKQFKQLHHQLREKRRKFLLDDSTSQSKSMKEKPSKQNEEKLREFHSLVNYRKHLWTNQLLHRKSKRRRMLASAKQLHSITPSDSAISSKAKCSHTSNHIRCKNSCLPYTKYCVTHIFEDPLQVLYKKCSKESCNTPVSLLHHPSTPNEIFCPLHLKLPPMCTDLDDLMEEIKSVSARIWQASHVVSTTTDCLVRTHRIVRGQFAATDPPASESHEVVDDPALHNQPTSPVSHNLPSTASEDSSMHIDKEKGSSMDLKIVAKSVIENKDTHSADYRQSTKDEAMDTIDSSTQKEESKQTTAATLNEAEKTSEQQSRLSPARMEEIKSGQCFFMNKITVFDETENRCMPAIHLEPVDATMARDLPKKTFKTSASESSPTTRDADIDGNLLPSNDLETEDAQNLSASMHHRGMKLTVEKQDADKGVNKQKVSTSMTLVPPVELLPAETLPNKDSKPDRDSLLQSMPPLVPIRVSPVKEAPFASIEDTRPGQSSDDPNPVKSVTANVSPLTQPTDQSVSVSSSGCTQNLGPVEILPLPTADLDSSLNLPPEKNSEFASVSEAVSLEPMKGNISNSLEKDHNFPGNLITDRIGSGTNVNRSCVEQKPTGNDSSNEILPTEQKVNLYSIERSPVGPLPVEVLPSEKREDAASMDTLSHVSTDDSSTRTFLSKPGVNSSDDIAFSRSTEVAASKGISRTKISDNSASIVASSSQKTEDLASIKTLLPKHKVDASSASVSSAHSSEKGSNQPPIPQDLNENVKRQDFTKFSSLGGKSCGAVDVDELKSGTDRKPSSADEETAIASLLFLSSGTLQKH